MCFHSRRGFQTDALAWCLARILNTLTRSSPFIVQVSLSVCLSCLSSPPQMCYGKIVGGYFYNFAWMFSWLRTFALYYMCMCWERGLSSYYTTHYWLKMMSDHCWDKPAVLSPPPCHPGSLSLIIMVHCCVCVLELCLKPYRWFKRCRCRYIPRLLTFGACANGRDDDDHMEILRAHARNRRGIN